MMVYDMSLLGTKYNGFQQSAASCSVTLNNIDKFDSSQFRIFDVRVNLSCESIAGSCSFKMAGLWRDSSTDWDPTVITKIKVGTPVSVSMGYVKKDEVFYGYIDSFTFVYPKNANEPYIQINALDALGFLMGVRDCVYAGENDLDSVVKKMLNECVSAQAAKSASTGLMPVKDFATVQRIKTEMSNYEFLKIVAEQTGRKFFAVKGEVMFEDALSFSAPLFTTPIKHHVGSNFGFYYVERTLSLDRQPGKVIVRGRDVDNNAIKAEVSMTTRTENPGMQASMAAPAILKGAVYDEDNPLVRTQLDCMALAQNRFNMLAMNYVRVYAICNGIPEMIPGRYLKISGLGKMQSGTYFITGVKHTFTKQGDSFATEVEMRGAMSL